MNVNVNRRLLALAAAGLVGGTVSVASAQTALINISGATAQENLFISPACTNDFIDADGNGVFSPGVQQLASGRTNLTLVGPPATAVWAYQYRETGSVNGFVELARFGAPFWTSSNHTTDILTASADKAFVFNHVSPSADPNRQYIASGAPNPVSERNYHNPNHPGGAPLKSDMSYLVTAVADSGSTPGTATGAIQIDIAPIDVPMAWVVQGPGTSSDPRATPGASGYGRNPKTSLTSAGAPANLPATLAELNGRNLFSPSVTPDANTLFETRTAVVVFAFPTAYGTGHQQMDAAQLRHLFATGRLPNGENLTAITRDGQSGTRNASMSSINLDPSWGVGENVGGALTAGQYLPSNATNEQQLGPNFAPSNKGGSGALEATLYNCRLGVGTTAAERGINSGWLPNRCELLAVRVDGGTDYVRPTVDRVLDNGLRGQTDPTDGFTTYSVDGYRIAGPAVLATIGDPNANAAADGGIGFARAFDPFDDLNCNGIWEPGEPYTDLNHNGVRDAANAESGLTNAHPAVANHFAAGFVNNIGRSLDAVREFPSGSAVDFSPGQFIASFFILPSAPDYVQMANRGAEWQVNPSRARCVESFTRGNSVFVNPAYAAFNTARAGLVPTRRDGVTYGDGVAVAAGSRYYLKQGGVPFNGASNQVGFGGTLDVRNKIADDFNGDGARNIDDTGEMLKAYRQRTNGNGAGVYWNAPDGVYGAGAGLQAIIEVLGDNDNDGSFTAGDVRYFADGLALVGGRVDRYAAFERVDTQWQSLTGSGNFFGTIIATGKPYAAGDSAGDIAGHAATPGYAPIGADGRVDGADIDYVFKQIRNGAVDWSDLTAAANADLSADINGDLILDQNDICFLLGTVLGTSNGDVNLDGNRDGADMTIALAHMGQTGGWAQGDVDGDGTITGSDIDIIANGGCSCFCPADYNRDGGVDGSDVESFYTDWEQAQGCSDVNADGGVDGGDVESFFTVWERGGCN